MIYSEIRDCSIHSGGKLFVKEISVDGVLDGVQGIEAGRIFFTDKGEVLFADSDSGYDYHVDELRELANKMEEYGKRNHNL